MSTSGTSSFNLTFEDIAEEAFERCGQELRTGYDLRTARRSLNLLLLAWSNSGINLWTVDQGQIPLNTGQGIYPLPLDTVDLLDHVVRQYPGLSGQTDISITRIAEPTYISIPNKLANGRPIQIYVNRQAGISYPLTATLNGNIDADDSSITLSSTSELASTGFITIGSEVISYMNKSDNTLTNCYRGQNGTTAASHTTGAAITRNNLPCIYIWPTPNNPGNQYTLMYYRLKRMQDAGAGGTFEQDIPFRFLPAMVAGLAYYLAMKLPGAQDRLMALKADYDMQWQLASDEDRDKSPVRFVPRNCWVR